LPQIKRSLSWVILHSVIIILTLISLFTGLRIATLTRPEVLRLSVLLPQGFLHNLHLVSAAGLLAVICAYLYLHKHENVKRFRHKSFHHVVTQFGYGVVLLSLMTGVLLYFGSNFHVQDVHYYSALAFILYVFMHGIVMFVQYGWRIFLRMFQVTKGVLSDGKILAFGITIFVAIVVFFQPVTDKTLRINKIPLSEIIEIDGVANEKIWQQALPITIFTHGGANFNNGKTPVSVRALHNGMEAFFHISWLDDTQSLKHLPLVKTENGWRVMEDGFYNFDEQSYYEDKFAVMLSDNCESGGSKTAHLGPNPIDDKPANWHGKGYHYADDGKVRDIWHWKAVRTNNMILADDNFFGSPDIVRSGQRRYPAGYLPDGKESGAYVMNWQWYSPQGIVPKRLPKDLSQLGKYQIADAKDWVVPWYDFTLYDPQLDTFPINTVAPSVLHYSNRFEGDRAHVRARGEWQDGRWHLELVRPLNTESVNDIPIKTGICFWVSAFDHVQIAHTRHTRPARLQIEGL